jgi:hypothetical protein
MQELQPDPHSVRVAVGVWHCTAEGEIIKGSGKTMLASERGKNAFGTLLIQRPAASKTEFSELVKKCNEYQAKLNEQHTQSI